MRVTFPSFDASVPTDAPRGTRDSVITGRGYLFSPPGSPVGRPSVVVMEGLGGLKESREIRYGRMLADRGYVALADTLALRTVMRRALRRSSPIFAGRISTYFKGLGTDQANSTPSVI
jgi:dienelactone hydrolase